MFTINKYLDTRKKYQGTYKHEHENTDDDACGRYMNLIHEYRYMYQDVTQRPRCKDNK